MENYMKETFNPGRAEGRAEGLNNGRIEGAKMQSVEIIKNMIRLGRPDDEISLLVGVPVSEVSAIRASMIKKHLPFSEQSPRRVLFLYRISPKF